VDLEKMVAEDDEKSFSDLMAGEGVKPLSKSDDKVRLKSRSTSPEQSRVRKVAAVTHANQDDWDLVPPLGPHDVVEFKSDGIQDGVFRKLKQGAYSGDARLDLHRHTVDDAHRALSRFVRDCNQNEIRSGLILHGKGFHSRAREQNADGKEISRIKSCVVHWLKGMEDVMAFSSARPADGGTGALYVLFRKSESAKEKNRQRFYK
jgi:DNA-nicking Smr family endonuclease